MEKKSLKKSSKFIHKKVQVRSKTFGNWLDFTCLYMSLFLTMYVKGFYKSHKQKLTVISMKIVHPANKNEFTKVLH